MSRRATLTLALGAIVLVAAGLCALYIWHRVGGARVLVNGGDAGGLARATPESERLDAAALERVVHDPAADGLRALVVMRDDHVVFERYGGGLKADSIVDSGPLAQVLVALLAAQAMQESLLSAQALNGFDPNRLRAGIEAGAHERYETYLSRKLWRRLNAAPAWIALPTRNAATPADCCFHARLLDWMRVATLLLADGRFEGTQVVPRGWVQRMLRPISIDGQRGFGVELAPEAQGAEPFAAGGVFWLRGAGHWRIWLVPPLRLAILFGADASAKSGARSPWDETRLPNMVIRAAGDRPSPQNDASLLQRLVPGH
jgi:CubicO group peptidase (beta-lactamase class C family)